MRNRATGVSLIPIFALFLAACAAPVKEQERTGFIGDYSRLEKVGDTAYLYTSPELAKYTQFRIDGPTMLFNVNEENADKFSAEEIEELRQYFRDRLTAALSEDNRYQVVEESGEGVATIRLGITALDATLGALNVSVATKITGAGLGGAAMEGEIVDSLSGDQLAAAVQWGSGSRVLRAGFTRLGDAKLQINRWTKNLRERIDTAHDAAAATESE